MSEGGETGLDNFSTLKFYEDVDSWETLMFLYNAALKEINTKIEILNDEFQHVHHYTPIEHIKSRIKTPESIVKKLKKNGYEVNVKNMVKHVRDIAGVRIICSFTSDIYLIADMLTKQGDLKIISLKDYIKHPKDSGYQSYHMLVSAQNHSHDGSGTPGNPGAGVAAARAEKQRPSAGRPELFLTFLRPVSHRLPQLLL